MPAIAPLRLVVPAPLIVKLFAPNAIVLLIVKVAPDETSAAITLPAAPVPHSHQYVSSLAAPSVALMANKDISH